MYNVQLFYGCPVLKHGGLSSCICADISRAALKGVVEIAPPVGALTEVLQQN